MKVSNLKEYSDNYSKILINPSLQGVNVILVLSFESDNGRTSHSQYYLPNVKIKC